jgi:hypothetical protein
MKPLPNERWYLCNDGTCVATVLSADRKWVHYLIGGYPVAASMHIFKETFKLDRRKRRTDWPFPA